MRKFVLQSHGVSPPGRCCASRPYRDTAVIWPWNGRLGPQGLSYPQGNVDDVDMFVCNSIGNKIFGIISMPTNLIATGLTAVPARI